MAVEYNRGEGIAIARLEQNHMTKERRNIYIACEYMDFCWDEQEVIDFRKMWKIGVPITVMASSFDREVDEVFALYLDQYNNGHIIERQGGVLGRNAI